MQDILRDIIAGGLYGVAVGDSLGAPLEFCTAEEIEKRHGKVTEMIGGGWLNVAPGEVTDDTQMTLAVAEGIMENPDDPIPAIGERFIAWARSNPKDIGGTCSGSIHRAAKISPSARPTAEQWFSAAKDTAKANGNRSGGNGALMRTVYPGLYYPSKLMAVEAAGAIAQMTHMDDKSTQACELYTNVIHYLVAEGGTGGNLAQIRDRSTDKIAAIFGNTVYRMDSLNALKGSLSPTGYVVDSFKCALVTFWNTNGFEEAIIFAANLGGDADTIAAITGGLAGAFYGYKAIPDRWLATLSKADRERLDAAVDAAVANRIAGE